LYDNDGAVLRPFNAYKNDVIKTEILERGANLWGITLEVGDTIYIPTGALHGAVNTDSDSLSLAYTSNFLDQEHAAQVLKEWCGDDLDRDSICYMLAKKDITSENGLFKDVLEKLKLFEQEEKELNEEIMSGRVVDGDQKKKNQSI